MKLNAFVICGLRGEISDGQEFLMSKHRNLEMLPKASLVTNKKTFDKSIDKEYYQHVIIEPFTEIKEEYYNAIEYSSVSQFLSESYKFTGIKEELILYSEDPKFYWGLEGNIETIEVILVNKMYDDCSEFFDIVKLYDEWECSEDSGWIKGEITYKKLKYIKRTV